MGSSEESGLDEASLKQWSEAELIALAEHMQQELDVRDRYLALIVLPSHALKGSIVPSDVMSDASFDIFARRTLAIAGAEHA